MRMKPFLFLALFIALGPRPLRAVEIGPGDCVMRNTAAGAVKCKTGAVPANVGGTGQTSYSTGDTNYASGPTAIARLPIGANGSVSTVVAGLPRWQPTQLQNYFLNGAVDFDQELGFAAKTSAATGQYVADNFKYSKVGTMVQTLQTVTNDAPTQAQAGFQFQNSVKLSTTTAEASLSSGDTVNIQGNVEGYVYQELKGKQVTLSFWAKAHRTGTYCVSFRNSGADRSYVIEYSINGADTWEQKSATLTLNPSGGTDNFTNGQGLNITWSMGAGSTWQTTANAWQTGSFTATSNQVNAVAATSDTFAIDGVQLNIGAVAGAFTRYGRSIYGEFAAVQRLYEKSYDPGTAIATTTSSGQYGLFTPNTGVAAAYTILFTSPKRVAPTLVAYNSTTGASGTWRDSGGSDIAFTSSNLGTRAGTLSGTSAHANATLSGHWVADARF